MRMTPAMLMAAAALTVASLPAPALAADASGGGAWTECQVASVAAFRDRLEVRCAPSSPAAGLAGPGEVVPREFAIETVGPLTDPTLRLAIEAKGRGRPLGILYVRDPGANPSGCAADRCRRIAGIELR